MSARGGADTPHYLLGHAESELRRLDLQDTLYRDVTVRAMRDAGIGDGMRVLDLGCGGGAVSFTAAELVGPTGSVVGIDRSQDGIAFARRQAASRGLGQVGFVATEVDAFRDERGFDALVGRFVLMHQADPAATLRAACRSVRPGGVVMIVESYMAMLDRGAHSLPHSPLYDRIVRWKTELVGGAGADVRAGARLRRTFLDAGLPAPAVRMEARLEGGPDSVYYRYVAESIRSMLPEARRLGLGGFDAADVDGLAERLRNEVVASGGVLVAWPVVAAWCRAPERYPDPRTGK